MKLRIVSVGKIKSKPIRELVLDYSSRISHYFPIECVDVKNEESTISSIKEGDFLVALDEHGEEKSSTELASFIKSIQNRGIKSMFFFVGGPEGIKETLKSRADYLLSLSRMTLPHEMARAVLLEQVYRACTILRGEAYHK